MAIRRARRVWVPQRCSKLPRPGGTFLSSKSQVSRRWKRLAQPRPLKVAAVVIEPLIQGAAGMRLWPPSTLRVVREWCSRTDTLLIVDEVMTGSGRTGRMFASEHESVIPDMMVLGKGLTGGYLPLAITLISEKVFSLFDGSVAEGK